MERYVIVAMRGRNIVDGKRKDYNGAPTIQRLEMNINDESNCLTGVQKDNLVVIQKTGGYCTTVKDNETGCLQSGGANVMDKVPNVIIQINPSIQSGGKQPYQQNRVYDTDGILPALPAQMSSGTHAIQVKSATVAGFEVATEGDSINTSVPNSKTRRGRVGKGVAQTLDTQVNQSVLLQGNIRRLTEIECERLQGFEDNHTKYGCYPISKLKRKEGDDRKNVSDQELFNELSNEEKINHFNQTVVKEIPQTQRYKMCGNAVNVATAKLVTDKLFDLF